MAYSLAQALLALESIESTALTPQALTDLVKQISVEASGSVTVFYGGKINGVDSASVIEAMVDAGDDIRVLDKSPVGQFLKSQQFLVAAGRASRLSPQEIVDLVDDNYRGVQTDWLYDAKHGPWASASKNFAAATTGEVRLLIKTDHHEHDRPQRERQWTCQRADRQQRS